MKTKSRENACVQKQDATSGRILPNCEFWERLCVLCSYTRCLLDLVPLSLWCTMGLKLCIFNLKFKYSQVYYSVNLFFCQKMIEVNCQLCYTLITYLLYQYDWSHDPKLHNQMAGFSIKWQKNSIKWQNFFHQMAKNLNKMTKIMMENLILNPNNQP